MGLIPFPAQVPWSDIAPWLGKPSQTFLQYLSSLDGIVRLIVSSGGSPRIILPSATTFYVATNGNDANNGLTPGTAWATLPHAIAVLTGAYDFGSQAVMLQGVAGHANFTSTLSLFPWLGNGSLVYDGAGGSIAVTGADAVNNPTASLPGPFKIQNVTLSSTTGFAFNMNFAGQYAIGSGVMFGACGQAHMLAQNYATIVVTAPYTISGGANIHLEAVVGSLVTNAGITQQATFTNNVVFNTSYVYANDAEVFWVRDGTATAPFNLAGHTVTGLQWWALVNGVINTAGQSPTTYFPGSGNIQQTGGQFI